MAYFSMFTGNRLSLKTFNEKPLFGFSKATLMIDLGDNSRGVPAYTQSTQLRTLIFESKKNKNVLNREKCNKNMPHPG